MSGVVVKRTSRATGPAMPEGRIELAEPPVLGEPATADLGSAITYLPMALGTATMALMFSAGSAGPTSYLLSGMMGASMIGMSVGQIGRSGMERRRRMRAERRDYLRYLAQLRGQADQAAGEQRTAALWDNPHPDALWALALGSRVWERRAGHEDFARIRIGLGTRRAALELIAPQTRPIEDLEPLSALSLRRFSQTYQSVAAMPISVGLRNFSRVEFAGDGERAAGLVRAMLGQLATFHSPDELRIAVLTDRSGREWWDWVKWLPHNLHPRQEDEAGPLRLIAGDYDELLALLGTDLDERAEHDKTAVPGPNEPFLVVVAHRTKVPLSSRLLGAGARNVVLLDLTGAMHGGTTVLRLTTVDGRVEYPVGDAAGSAAADGLSVAGAHRLARTLAPLRTADTIDLTDKPLETDFDLTALLAIRDPCRFDVAAKWRPRRAQPARMRVPIGVTEQGEAVELDLKESARGGMGPHGLLIGATGSGKSELLRTLIMGLVATHSSEILNLILVDFKGGATFMHMDRLPHTSAVITNLAGELPLVDRMQDALNGEVIRRQELLRERGYGSLFDYEKARAGGARLPALPTLLLVVDEFSELLASKPEFIELFVTIGRVGRSLGIHLLLASQRLDEGRIHRVEGHLSYRIALRTFSSMESRSVIGVSSAYELPSAPGNGYLRVDTTNLLRFKAAYVSAAFRDRAGADDIHPALEPTAEVVTFGANRPPAPALPAPVESTKEEVPAQDGPSLLEILVDRLADTGPPAHQVWLPPLHDSPSLDQLLPGIEPDGVRGLAAAGYPGTASLRIPVGLVDRPYEQVRDLLVADLRGADGHVGVVGAPQAGKSTLLRTLMLSLALTHTPAEVQFYCLDFGGGGLASVAALPHVGSVAGRLDRDRVLRTVEEVYQVLEQREQRFTALGLESVDGYRALRAAGEVDDPFGDMFLVIDGWATLRQEFEELEPRITDLAARGLSFGIHVVLSVVRWSEVRPRVRDLLGTRFELRLGDPLESEVGGRRAMGVPTQPGRGLTRSGHHFLTALPRLDGSGRAADLAAATRSAAAELGTFWPGRTAPGVRLLPTRLPVRELPEPEGEARIALGMDEQRLAPVWHDFDHTPHLMVFGDAETGKTNALRLIARAVTQHFPASQARILLGDPSRALHSDVPAEYRIGYAVDTEALAQLSASAAVSMTARLPGPDVTPEQLAARDWWQGPRLFLLIDDYDLFAGSPGPLAPLIPLLAQSAHIGLHLVVARSTSSAMRAMVDPVLRRLWELGGPGLLLSYPREEGKFLGEAKPRSLPPGRAQLVTRRDVRLIQTGLVPSP
jgi:S-DNA-T family DNA segregation ATPase FtsK/SpoIIIE